LSAVDGAVLGAAGGLQIKAMERRKHGEFELKSVVGGDLKRDPLIMAVFGNLDTEDLQKQR
jgi:hypothetical protein